MIYLDYAANTPADESVLETFCEVSRKYIANPSSPHPLGAQAAECLAASTRQIAGLLGVKESEIIYTSGASESNNLAIKGVAGHYKKYGRHIVSTWLEHSSVNGPLAYLQSAGFEVDYVGLTDEGLIDTEQLKELLRDDTILVSICCVDSEIGLRQPVDKIADILSARPHCLFHVDATQAVGKIPVSAAKADLLTFAPHKFYGLNGCGMLVKKDGVLLEPQIHGGVSTTPFRSGTPALALIASAAKALSLAVADREPRLEYVERLNQRLREALSRNPRVRINSTRQAVPFILNISLPGIKTDVIQKELAQKEICVATRSACCAPNTVSRPVLALTRDKKRALSPLRISLSHLTAESEISVFLDCFEEICKKY